MISAALNQTLAEIAGRLRSPHVLIGPLVPVPPEGEDGFIVIYMTENGAVTHGFDADGKRRAEIVKEMSRGRGLHLHVFDSEIEMIKFGAEIWPADATMQTLWKGVRN